ncbi:hypothetical protein SCHPADRAFT_995885 [Schizopora paradoxa]|uniref:Csf1 N-terminal domain-containing protein n=1 Tax=Schizopora paradoxa TaxID=27342 RepID=A0A0H2RU89_9AGAM|nr:hypothetical protein SCHPADRAFT_995885 [Schizopora paradoxa]
MLDVVLLVACVLVALAAVLYIFFWNKLFALILSFVIRLVCWTRSGIWIEFGSVHLSLLAGRILLKNVRYHSSNQTFRIVKCQFSWRYWIRTVAEEEDLVEAESAGKGSNKPHECRIHISMEGFEWFMYNKTAATDAILEHLVSSDPEARRLGTAKSRESTFVDMNRPSIEEELVPGGMVVQEPEMPKFLQRIFAWFRRQMPDLDVKNLLPISFDATKGAILLGNHTTENLLLAQFASASGTYGIVQSRSKLDLYKQSLRMSFQDPLLSFVENADFWGSMNEIGTDVHDCIVKENARYPKGSILSLSVQIFTRLWRRARLRFPFFNNRHRRYAHPEKDGKKKRKAPKEEECHVGADFSKLEYGVERNILEAPQLDLVYYADFAGPVPNGSQIYEAEGLENMDIGNGGLPPEWGIELVTYSASIHYGPWADRQRVQLQRVFFPPTFQNHEPLLHLRPGDQRMCTCLKIFVEFRETTILHVPFREASKDWQWDGKADYVRNSKLREPASMQFRAGDASTLKYLVPMVATTEGYTAEMELILDKVAVSSSLNDMVILDADSYKLSSRLPSPLCWDEERTWDFNMVFNDTSGSIIRDQINMFTDLGKDWSSGPPNDFNTFVPTVYGLSVSFQGGFDIDLFANDHNVIDRPSDKPDNTIFTLQGETLRTVVLIPSNRFRPLDNVMSFQVEAPDIAVDLTLPKWNTHTFCPPKQLSETARLSSLLVNASFRYHSEVHAELVDELTLDIKCEAPRVKLLGWVVRHFMVLRENYFGSFTQYTITREYLAKLASAAPPGDPFEMKYRKGKNNAFQVQLSAHVSDGVMCVPAGLPGFEKCTGTNKDEPDDFGPGSSTLLFVPELLVQLRSNDVGMEMSLTCDPISFSCVKIHTDSDIFLKSDHFIKSSRQLCISGLEISANRLFGPPPRNLTYACVWEINVGEIKGLLSAADGFLFLRSFQSFMRGFNDYFNAPGLDFTATDDRDVTFLKVTLAKTEISWRADESSLRLLIPKGLCFDFSSLAGSYYRSATNVWVPEFSVRCLLFVSSTKRWLEVGHMTGSLSLDWYKRPFGWRADAEKQRKFLDVQDSTGRISGLRSHEYTSVSGWCDLFRLQNLSLPFGSDPSVPAKGPAPSSRRRSYKQTRRSSSNSDSNEAPLMDFDWDAHLANQKPSGLSDNGLDIVEDPNTSLDESDETDASMSDDSWMDYFDLDEETELEVDGVFFRPAYYRNFCRQYALQRRDRIREFESMYVLTRDSIPTHGDQGPSIAEEVSHSVQRKIPLLSHEDLGCGQHSIRVESSSDILLFVTPLLVPAIACLQGAISQMPITLELTVDGLTLDATSLPSVSCFDAEFTAPSIRTIVVQDLMPQNAFSALTLSTVAQSSDVPSRIASITQFHMERASVLFRRNPYRNEVIPSEESYGRISVGRSKFLLTPVSSSPSLKQRFLSDLGAKSEVIIEGLHAVINGRKLQGGVERIATQLNHLSPGTMVATGLELSNAGNALFTSLRVVEETKQMALRRKLLAILVLDCNRPSADILSAIQPSFFVQAGRPTELRQDLNWKLLFHLRRALASTAREEREELDHQSSLPISMPEMIDKLGSQRVPWINESEGPTFLEMPLFRSLFKPTGLDGRSEASQSRPSGLLISIMFRVAHLEFSYADSDSSIPNTVAINSIDLQFDYLSRGILVPLNLVVSREASAGRTDMMHSVATMVAWADVRSIQVAIYPTFILFLRNAIHASKTLFLTSRSPSKGEPKPAKPGNLLGNRIIVTELRLSLHDFLFEAAAENLIFEVASKEFSSSILLQVSGSNDTNDSPFDISGNYNLCFDKSSLKARARPGADPKYNRDDTLAAIVLSETSFCTTFQKRSPQGPEVRSTFHMVKISLDVPRSAIRLYHFFEQWRQDYFLGIEAMLNSLFSEIRSKPRHENPKIHKPRPLPMSIVFHASISKIAINLRVMHGTWLSWSAGDVVTYIKGVPNQSKNLDCGLQVASQRVEISSMVSSTDEGKGLPKPTILLLLPSLRTTGTYSSSHIDLIVLVGEFHATIKPSHWDSLLSVQQKFGQDFNDLLALVGDTRRRRTISGSQRDRQMVRRTPFNVTARSEGFKIGLEGLNSTQYLECFDVDAVISDTGVRRWFLTFKSMALYLSPKSSEYRPDMMNPLRVNVDFEISGNQSTSDTKGLVELSVTRFHVVLQPNSISEVSDFIDHLQAEVLLRQEQRAMELEEFKLKAKKVMQTFNTKPKAYPSSSSQTVLTGRTVKVSMTNFGVVFPLELTRTYKMQKAEFQHVQPTKAFLIAIDSLEFHTHEGERGQFLMKGFSFQFVPRFRPSVKSDFLPRRHQTLNKLVYPEMRARVHSDSTSRSRKVSVVAEINGFILDIDPTITGYVFSLVDIYRQGRERVERLAAGLPKSVAEAELHSSPEQAPIQLPSERKVTSNILASLSFRSGTVRMHQGITSNNGMQSPSEVLSDASDEAEIFKLPELTLWSQYTTLLQQEDRPELSISPSTSNLLIFKATVHSSHNVLKPSLLPFVTEVVQSIEDRMKKVPTLTVPHSPAMHKSSASKTESLSYMQQASSRTLEMIFSLQIDQSRLELTCKPDANVVAGLHWDNGGFVVSVSPGREGVSISGTIGGLTTSLKHGFLSDDCANLDARNLNFSINFSKSMLPSRTWINAVSIVVDTEFSGNIRFSRLQDFLVFKAVWLDRIPVFSGDGEDSPVSLSKSSTSSSLNNSKQGFDTAILIHVRRIALEADLGQSICTVTLDLKAARARTRLTESFSEISVSVDEVDIAARGNLSGYLRMPNFVFRTVQRRIRRSNNGSKELNNMLELNLTTGTLDAQLQSDWLWLLQYRAEPLEAVVYDDWALIDAESKENRQLRFLFSVNGTKVLAMMTIMAIPKLVMYAGKFMANLEAQREGASRESSAFRSTRLPKPDNALSQVANAMFQAARSRLKESETLSYVIGQHMALKLEELVFVVLPRSQGDNEIARFIGINVMAQLDRTVRPDGRPAHRDLRLSLSHMSISQLVKQGFDPRRHTQDFETLTSSTRRTAGDNVIFSLPAMDMTMITDDEVQNGLQILSYDFDSKFIRSEGHKDIDNINISFNLSLYSWLTLLRKTFTRELRRAQETAEFRSRADPPRNTPAPPLSSSTEPNATKVADQRTYSPPERASSPTRGRSQSSERLSLPSPKTALPRSQTQVSITDTGSTSAWGESSSSKRAKQDISSGKAADIAIALDTTPKKTGDISYNVRSRRIERLTVRQLGEATPDVMHPFFMKKAGFNLEESLPQFVHEYATLPIEQIMKVLLKLYSKQLRSGTP